MAKPKITAIIQSLGGGGAERICITLCNGFVEQGCDVELIVLNPKNAVFDKKLHNEVTLNCLDATRARYAFFKLMRYISRQKPESLLVFNYHVALLLIITRLICRFKTKIIVRNISTLSLRHKNDAVVRGFIFHWLTKIFYSKADKIIAQSQGMKRDLLEHYNISDEKCIVIYNPVSPEIENYTGSRLGEKNHFLCIGRLENVKAFNFAIKAFAEVQKRYPETRLKFVGNGSQKNDLKKLCQNLGVSEKVDFADFHDDVIPFYIGAKATVLTSLYEGFPNVLVELISLGTPIVAFDCQSGPSEIIKENINGYLVRYQDMAHLIECLEKAWSKNWDEGVLRQTAERYRSATIVKNYLDILEA